jgi:DNA polymerase III gamma/tau subunit
MDALTVITEAERETRNSNQHRLLLEMALLKLTKLPSAPIALAIPQPSTAPQQVTPVVHVPPPVVIPRQEAPTVSVSKPPISHTLPEPEEGDIVAEEEAEIDRLTIPMFGTDNEPAELPPIAAPTKAVREQSAAVEAEERELISETTEDIPDELRYLQQHWTEAINHMRVISQGGVSLMNDAKPIAQVGQTIVLEFTQSSFVARLESPRAMEKLQEVINKVLKKQPKTISIKAVLKGAPTTQKPATTTARETSKNISAAVTDAAPSDLLDEVISVFGGRIIEGDGPSR